MTDGKQTEKIIKLTDDSRERSSMKDGKEGTRKDSEEGGA